MLYVEIFYSETHIFRGSIVGFTNNNIKWTNNWLLQYKLILIYLVD
jgi:hypothetical protein